MSSIDLKVYSLAAISMRSCILALCSCPDNKPSWKCSPPHQCLRCGRCPVLGTSVRCLRSLEYHSHGQVRSTSQSFLLPPSSPPIHLKPTFPLLFRCTFVQVDEYCMEDVNRINYLALFYCNNKVGMIFAGLAWLILLFFVMTITAEIFLCPAIEVRWF